MVRHARCRHALAGPPNPFHRNALPRLARPVHAPSDSMVGGLPGLKLLRRIGESRSSVARGTCDGCLRLAGEPNTASESYTGTRADCHVAGHLRNAFLHLPRSVGPTGRQSHHERRLGAGRDDSGGNRQTANASVATVSAGGLVTSTGLWPCEILSKPPSSPCRRDGDRGRKSADGRSTVPGPSSRLQTGTSQPLALTDTPR